MRALARLLPLSFLLIVFSPTAGSADGLTVLTRGKAASFGPGAATVRFGRDRALGTLLDPRCPTPSSVQLASYPEGATLLDAQPIGNLPCSNWRPTAKGYRYRSSDGYPRGVRRIDYRPDRLVVSFGKTYAPIVGPVAYLEMWFRVGTTSYLGRFHRFTANGPTRIVARRVADAAADGEQAFWDVLHGDDASAARQAFALDALMRASDRDERDARSRFLLGMMHLYRFGQMVVSFDAVSPAAVSEITAAVDALDAALPMLWDGSHGDSRIPGFAAAAKWTKGRVLGDAALMAMGLADLQAAIAVNPNFNLFDYIPIAQALLAQDPLFAQIVGFVDGQLSGGLGNCVFTQPEICGNAGLAPNNIAGSLMVFGDLYAKGGLLAPAQGWYDLAMALTQPTYPFFAALQDRASNAATRVALYQNGDPSDDPPMIGAGAEACATCHRR